MKKDLLLIVLILVSIALLVVCIGAVEKTNKITKSLDEERYSRMVAEESLQKNAAKLSTLEVQLKSANERMAQVQDLMNRQKTANADLQKQYEDLSNVKADLEAKLKAVAEQKIASPEAQSK